MNNYYLPIAFAAMALLAVETADVRCQTQPVAHGSCLSQGGISSRNMELLGVIVISMRPMNDDRSLAWLNSVILD